MCCKTSDQENRSSSAASLTFACEGVCLSCRSAEAELVTESLEDPNSCKPQHVVMHCLLLCCPTRCLTGSFTALSKTESQTASKTEGPLHNPINIEELPLKGAQEGKHSETPFPTGLKSQVRTKPATAKNQKPLAPASNIPQHSVCTAGFPGLWATARRLRWPQHERQDLSNKQQGWTVL